MESNSENENFMNFGGGINMICRWIGGSDEGKIYDEDLFLYWIYMIFWGYEKLIGMENEVFYYFILVWCFLNEILK